MMSTRTTIQNGAPDNANVIALPPLIFVTVLVLALLTHFVFPIQLLPQRPALGLGIALILVSLAIATSAIRTMSRLKTTHDVRQPTTTIVTDGPFRFSRNPIYLSGMLLYLGIASLVNSPWIFLFAVPLMAVIQQGVIKREERYLERKFRDEYLRYKARVRRWV